ncbi:MAG: ribosome maturation factor RimM [Gammaproteobacteria bacterium]
MCPQSRKILIGKLGKPHGIKGYIYFHYYGEEISNLKNYKDLYLEGSSFMELEKMFKKSDRLIIKFKECSDRNSAEELRDKEVFVKENDLLSLEQGEYYLYQLEGLIVKNLENKFLGNVKGTIGTKSNEVLVVESSNDSIDDEERLIPYVKPQVVKEIKLEEGFILVDWPENF